MASTTHRKRFLIHGGNALLVSIAVIGIAVVGYILVDRFRPFKLDLTKEGLHSLAPKTKEILKGLDRDVTVTYFRRPANREEDATFVNDQVHDLLEDFKIASKGKLTYEVADPYFDQDKMIALGGARGAAVFQSADQKIVVQGKEIYQTSMDEFGGEEGMHTGFAGEGAFDSAILRLREGKKETACFLTGHRESSIDSQEEGGLRVAIEFLKQENLESKNVDLNAANDTPPAIKATIDLKATPSASPAPAKAIPDDCSVLVIANPQANLAQAEIDSILAYWEKGHGLVVMLEPMSNSNIGTLTAKLGVTPMPGIAVDPRASGDSDVSIIPDYKQHEIILDMAAHAERTVLPDAVGLTLDEHPDTTVTLTPFLQTSKDGRELVNIKGGKADMNDAANLKGPLVLAVAIEKVVGHEGDVTTDNSTKTARAVVIGSTLYAANVAMMSYGAGNIDLFKNMVHYASGSEEKIGIAPKEPGMHRVTISESGILWVVALTGLVMPASIFGGGIAVWLKRRRR